MKTFNVKKYAHQAANASQGELETLKKVIGKDFSTLSSEDQKIAKTEILSIFKTKIQEIEAILQKNELVTA